MKLRKLEIKDAPLMLEWMHDKSVTKNMRIDFMSKTLKDCEKFIQFSWEKEDDLHFAIASEEDEYMGTVSLKHIENGGAEFAIIVRREAMGKGYAKYGMNEIMRTAAIQYGIKYVYWCVNPDNSRAIRFYEKNNYKRVKGSSINIKGGYSKEQIQNYYWYLYQV